MKFFQIIALGLITLSLTGCVSRKQADDKLVEACKNAAQAFLEERYTITKASLASAESNTVMGGQFREVKLDTTVNDGFMDDHPQYSCLFTEQFGPMGMNYTASIHQLNLAGEIYGYESLSSPGSHEVMKKLNDAAAKALDN